MTNRIVETSPLVYARVGAYGEKVMRKSSEGQNQVD